MLMLLLLIFLLFSRCNPHCPSYICRPFYIWYNPSLRLLCRLYWLIPYTRICPYVYISVNADAFTFVCLFRDVYLYAYIHLWQEFVTPLLVLFVNNWRWKLEENQECCHFVSSSLYQWCHKDDRRVWYEPDFFCSLLVDSKPIWLRTEEPKSELNKHFVV